MPELKEGFKNILKIKDLRDRILITLGIIAIFRIGVSIPIPGVNIDALKTILQSQIQSIFGFLDMFSGGALSNVSIFSLGIIPYINASIMMSLIQGTHAIRYIDRLASEGEQGRKKITQITRYLALIIAVIQSLGLQAYIKSLPVPGGVRLIEDTGIWFTIHTTVVLVGGTALAMWLAELITEFGVGNGTSLIIFSGIVDKLPASIYKIFLEVFFFGQRDIINALILLAIVLVVTSFVVLVATGNRQLQVQYAQRVVGRKVYGGATTYIPIKVDQAGVIAVIFAVSFMALPYTLAQFFPDTLFSKTLLEYWIRGSFIYEVVYIALIIFFCYFYNSIILNPNELAENLKKWGGFLPGVRPGEETAKYIKRVVARITLWGSIFVALIAVLPDLLREILKTPFYFGGTSILITVGVALDTIGQIESHLIMRQYDTILKKGAIKGRWYNVR
ncbi:MAG: preprotein translocase subunit SecY [bacterium]|nr:preprotein translocase subunit SecY [bacterium]